MLITRSQKIIQMVLVFTGIKGSFDFYVIYIFGDQAYVAKMFKHHLGAVEWL